MSVREVCKKLGGVWHGSYFTAACPVCQPEKRRDQVALSGSEKAGKLLLKCHKSGCSYVDIIRAAEIDAPQPAPETPEASLERRAQEGRRLARGKVYARKVFGASDRQTHPYLSTKGFPTARLPTISFSEMRRIMPPPKMYEGLKPSDSLLAIPLRDLDGTLASIQFIDAEGNKCFLPGGRVNKAAFRIGRDGQIVLCEGVATGLSIWRSSARLALPVRILCCMSAGNVEKVSLVLKNDNRRHIAVADHDTSGVGARAARHANAVLIPPTVGEDFNDYERALPREADSSLRRILNDAATQ